MIETEEAVQYKDMEIVPPVNKKNNSIMFSRLLDDDKVVASYKMYWLLGILDEVSSGNIEIKFKRLIARMIVYAWYPHQQYKLNFGVFDNLKRSIYHIAEKYKFASNCDEKELLEFLFNNKDDKELLKMMKELTNQVPYRLLSPFFSDELYKVKKNSRNNLITDLALHNEECLYKIVKDKENKIIINDCWIDYLKENYKVIKAWIYYKLVCFIQKRNPNVPAIVFKLESPKHRNLSKATKLWKKIILVRGVIDIYTGEKFTDENFDKHGVLSIDHFIPWSFVLHDEMWNLIPTFKNINSIKSNNLLRYKNYIEEFCNTQYQAFSYICDKKVKYALEDYANILRVDNPCDYYKHYTNKDFNNTLMKNISPLYQIAENQGFRVIDKLI
ncbi:HNH endonuclease domain-containing protein [Clostridium neuense]|uniref:HNH endonuclease domain-containing protein n=1 Tax=Clostridium neuense TaxID=1728934 RepID=A0ABW8TBZ6_9CLOT